MATAYVRDEMRMRWPSPSTLGRRLSTRFEGGIDVSCRNQRGQRILQAAIGPRFLACSIPSWELARNK